MRTLRYQTLSVGLNCLRVQFPSCNLFEAITCRYEWNEQENTRISRMHATTPSLKQREQRRTRLACEKKEQRTLRLAREKVSASPWSTKTSWAKSLRAEETSQESQKRLKAQRQWGASRRQCQTDKQKLAGCWIKAKVYSPQQQRPNQQQLKYLPNQQLRFQRHFMLPV